MYTTSFTKENNKVLNQDHFRQLMINLPDGYYHVIIQNIKDKTLEKWRHTYFAIIEVIVKITGLTKQEVHEEVKKALDVDTTKNFDQKDWASYIYKMKKFYFKQKKRVYDI